MEEALKEKLAKANAENKGVVVFPDYFRKKKDKINPNIYHISSFSPVGISYRITPFIPLL